MNHYPVIEKWLAEKEMLAFAETFARKVDGGTIIFLYGSLGAGKTTFTRGFLHGLGYVGKVKSPTYTLVEPYEVGERKIFHFDLYRLTHPDELEQMGIRDYFTEDSICLIEWPENGFSLLPTADVACHFAFNKEGREVRIEALSDKGSGIVHRLCE
jgi:tRNA threonylcarbamoyladenosine biosynthesis protein TsaE